MKKLLFAIAIFFSFTTSAQNYYLYGKDTITQRPGYLYLQRPLYLLSPLYHPNDSTIGVNASFIGVDTLPHFIYKQSNQTRTSGIGLIDSIITSGIQFSPSLLLSGVDTVLGGLHKKVGFENYVEPILNTISSIPSYRLRWFADTTVNSNTGVGVGYPGMDLYYNASRSSTGFTLDFPNTGTLSGGSFTTGNVYGMTLGQFGVTFPMGASTPLSVSTSTVTIGNYLVFASTATPITKLGTSEIAIGSSTLESVAGGLQCQVINLGNPSTFGAGIQFGVFGSAGAYGGSGSNPPLHNAGSLTSTSGSSNITGTGTHFLTTLNVGDTLIYNITGAGGTQTGKIASITDDTHLTLTANSTVTSGNGYWYNYSLLSAPFFKVAYNGTPYISRPFITSNLISRTTTIAAGTGAGTSPTVSITGNDISGYVTITTGTSPTAGGDVATITFSTPLMNTPTSIQLTAAGENAAVDYAKVYVDQSSVATTSWKIKNISSAALQASTTYKFYYTVTQ